MSESKKKKRRKHQVRAVNPGTPPSQVTSPKKSCYDQQEVPADIRKLKSLLLK